MKSRNEILGFDDKWLMIIGIPIVSVIMSMFFYSDQAIKGFSFFTSWCTLISLLYTTIYWICFRSVVVYFRKNFPRHNQVRKRIIYQTATLFVCYFLVKLVMELVAEEELHRLAGITAPHSFLLTIGSLMISFLVISIYESIFFYNKLNTSLLEKEQLERENIISQLEGLKNQVNPHFLFNSLNTLSYIIPEDANRAVQFVQQLSKVYRYILEIRDEKLISLKEELTFLESYVFLLKSRFGDNLVVDINIDKSFLNTQIVPLSLQILFENAIKHNIISTQQPLKVEVFVGKQNKLIVKNNLQRKNQVMSTTKVGLQNIKNRYKFLSDKLVEIIVTTNAFMVSLPLLESESVILGEKE